MEADWDEFPQIEAYPQRSRRPSGHDAPTTQLIAWEQGTITRPLPAIDYAAQIAAIEARGARLLRAFGMNIQMLLAGIAGQILALLILLGVLFSSHYTGLGFLWVSYSVPLITLGLAVRAWRRSRAITLGLLLSVMLLIILLLPSRSCGCTRVPPTPPNTPAYTR